MKNYSIFLFVTILFYSCASQIEKKYQTPKQTIVTGKVKNFDPKNDDITISVNRIGFGSEQHFSNIDSLGNFNFSFETYIPTDLWISYKTNFLVLVHPGDSIHVVFEGYNISRPKLLNSIQFSGDAIKSNQDAAVFQSMYYSSDLFTQRNAKVKARQTYDMNRYSHYLDSLQQKGIVLYNQFISEIAPNEETKKWAFAFIKQDYYTELAYYPSEYRRANQLKANEWDVPVNFYDPFNQLLPITDSLFISGHSISSYINRFSYRYVGSRTQSEKSNLKYLTERGTLDGPSQVIDSINIYSIINYTPDTLLRQLVLTDRFANQFKYSMLEPFERFQDLANKYIQEPFLKEPLWTLYEKTKVDIERKQEILDSMLIEATNSSLKNVFTKAIFENKGKVIYVDCWYHGCKPCIREIPNIKQLMKEMEGKDIAFVSICARSTKNAWKSIIDEYKLGGQHFLLSKKESIDLERTLVDGYPCFFLIDKTGKLVDKGTHLRPNRARQKIKKLLSE